MKTRIAPWISDEILDKLFDTWNVDNYIYREGPRKAWFVLPPEITVIEKWYSDVNYSSKSELGYISMFNCIGYNNYFTEFLNLTTQEYFDLMVLHIKYVEDRPRCPYCNTYLPFLSLYAGYGNTDKDWKSKCTDTILGIGFCSSSCKMKYMRSSDEFKLKSTLDEFNKTGGAYGLMHSNPVKYKDFHEKWLKTLDSFSKASRGTCTLFKSNKFKKSFTVKSNMEYYCALWAEQEDLVVDLDYEPIKDQITYRYKGRTHYYIPDFLIKYSNGDILLVEIKPHGQIKELLNQSKFRAARKYCKKRGWKFTIWTEFDV